VMSDITYAGQSVLNTSALSQLVSGYFGSIWSIPLSSAMPVISTTDVPGDAQLADELAYEDLVEMANLPEEDTDVPGTVFISTRMGRHGPRVKYFDGRAGEAQPSLSVSIAHPPRVMASSLPNHVVSQRGPLVEEWVALNRDALLQFWNEGTSWTRAEVARFLEGLKRVEKH
jgi:hypothetical protein